VESDDAAGAVSDHVSTGRCEVIEEGCGVVRHGSVAEQRVVIGRSSVSASVDRDEPSVLSERSEDAEDCVAAVKRSVEHDKGRSGPFVDDPE
jgi:UDP-3-O-[3-hydroxymyristoyl] glucosamine N-acyltransferase